MADPLSLELSKGGETISIPSERVVGVDNFSLEHTAIAGFDIRIAPASPSVVKTIRDMTLADVDIHIGDLQLPGWTLIRSRRTGGDELVLTARGPGRTLKQDTTVATYDKQPVYDAIEDYVEETPADWTVREPFVRVVDDNEPFVEAPMFESIDEFFADSITPTTPIEAAYDSIKPCQTSFFEEAEDTTQFGTIVSAGQDDLFSGNEAVRFDAAGEYIEWTVTPDYTIPEDELDLRIRYRLLGDDSDTDLEDFHGDIYFDVDGTRILDFSQSDVTRDIRWGFGLRGLYEGGDVDGTTTFEVGVETNNKGDYSGFLDVDCVAPFDMLERYGFSNSNAYTFDNTVTENALEGPQEYPSKITVSGIQKSVWHISDASVDTEIDDVSGKQALAISADGNQVVKAPNSRSVSADFDAEEIWGDAVDLEVTLGRWDGGDDTTTPTTGDAPQELTALDLFLTTDDLPLISEPLTLDDDSWFSNLQTLHDQGDMRWTVDYSADSLTIDSYRRGDPDLVQPAEWTTDGLSASSDERDASRYANQVNVEPPPDATYSPINLRLSDEVDRVGKIAEVGVVASATERDPATREARRELRRRVGLDKIRGDIQIVPALILPGYPYEPAEFDGRKSNLETTQFSWDGDGVSGSLSFGSRRSTVALIQERTG